MLAKVDRRFRRAPVHEPYFDDLQHAMDAPPIERWTEPLDVVAPSPVANRSTNGHRPLALPGDLSLSLA